MAKEWVDHSLDMAKKAKNKLEAAERATQTQTRSSMRLLPS